MSKSVTELLSETEARLESLTAENATLSQKVESLKAQLADAEAKAKKVEEEDEEEEAKKKAKAKEDEEKAAKKKAEDEEKEKAMVALSDRVQALEAAIASGSLSGVPEGGADAGGEHELTEAEALVEYNKINPNDAKARAEFRAKHAVALGIKR